MRDESGTRQVVLDLIVEKGPVSAVTLASILDLTPAAIRRHLIVLSKNGQIEAHDALASGPRTRGRPARFFVATDEGRSTQHEDYASLAIRALGYLTQVGGQEAVEEFAHSRSRETERRYAPRVHAAGSDRAARVRALADALAIDGYAATVREVGNGIALQICQGSCPVQEVAAQFPQICEAETQAFARLLDVHVQRLATLADGEHVCTTSIPLGMPASRYRTASHRLQRAVTNGGTDIEGSR
ncbi:MAG: transcriptional regulator [Actinomycetaceae bacterium]|nr:transcriptional regulator [Actinomycetaceae bacterium]